MPAIYTHRLFAEAAARKLPAGLLANQEQKLAFYLGNQGPDPLFYRWRAEPALGAKIRQLGHHMHDDAPARAFCILKEAVVRLPEEDQALGRAFALGLLGHWCLDSGTHPFVFSEQAAIIACDPDTLETRGGQVHAIIEAKLDSWLLWKLQGLTVLDINPASVLLRSPHTDEVAGALMSALALDAYETDLPPHQYGASVDDMQAFYRFAEPKGSPHCRFLGAAECLVRQVDMPQTPFMTHEVLRWDRSPWENPDHLPWKDPSSGQLRTESFFDLYQRALASLSALVPAYLAAQGRECQTLFTVNFRGEPPRDPNETSNASKSPSTSQ